MISMYHQQEEEKKSTSSKIFRPWDAPDENVIQQDATISTTSEQNHQVPVIEEMKTSSMDAFDMFQHPPTQSSSSSISSTAVLPNFYSSTSAMPYIPVPPQEYLPGLPTDLLISPNYALEEYARILSQDHQAKLLHARKQRPKKYKCPHCDVGFSNNGQLKGHIRIHTGERPFKCDDPNCGKTFTRNEELTRHKRIHSGLRPFSCTQCGKRFGRKDHLKKHSRTHMQPRNGMYAVPVMLPLDTWAQVNYPYMTSVPMLY